MPMKTFALALALAAALAAPAAHAKPFLFFGGHANRPAARTAAADAPLGRDGQDTRQVCSSQNPNIEYRDCVNAATRDPNAKVRLG
jgi:hypothetical protein